MSLVIPWPLAALRPWLRGRLCRAALVAVSLGLGACDSGPTGPVGDDVRCADIRCPRTLRCAAGTCVGGEAPAARFDLRIVPPTDSAFAPVEVEGVEFEDDVVRTLTTALPIPPPIDVVGQALGPTGGALIARASARPNRGIPVRPLVISSEALLNPGNPGFRLGLAPWWPTPDGGARQINYSLLIEPDGLPPWRVDALQVEADLPAQRFDLPASDVSALPALSGRVVVSAANPTPLRDLVVVVLDDAGRSVGTTTRTDETGAFSIAVWPSASPRALTLRVSSDDDARPLPVVRVPVTVPADGAPAPVQITFGEVGALYEQVGRVGDAEAPVADATVRLTATIGAGEFTTTVRTDAAGVFSARVYPGEYVVDVVPPLTPEAPLRLTRRAETLSRSGAPIRVVPLARSQVFGAVVDGDGEPLAGARLVSTLLEARYGDPRLIRAGEVPPPRTVVGVSAQDGTFDLPLDPGRHRVQITPDPKTGLASFAVEFEFSGDSGRPAEIGTLVAPPAAVLLLTLAAEGGAPVAGASVEAWSRTDPPLRVAQGMTDAAGAAVLAIPNPAVEVDAGVPAPGAAN